MNPLEKLKEEHLQIERELLELEAIMQEPEINYPNLVHVLRNLFSIWKEHEEKEEKAFAILKKERIIVPVKTMLFDHGILRPHREVIISAINSGNNQKIKESLNKSGRFIVNSLRKHIRAEDEVLYTLALEELTEKDIEELSKILL
jgi:hemerythrin-like domain-containing protein